MVDMAYEDFLDRVIREGITAAKKDYNTPSQKSKLQGSVEGFRVCIGKQPEQIARILKSAQQKTHEAHRRFHLSEISLDSYWRKRCFEIEIEWVANVVSAALINAGQRPIITPTARGALKAAEILGVKK